MPKTSLRQRVADKLKSANESQSQPQLSKREKTFVPELARSPRAGFTPELLQAQAGRLRRTLLTPAMPQAAHSDHDHLTLFRQRGQTAQGFTDFMVETRRALHQIDSQPMGQKLLTDLNAAPNVSRLDNHSRVIFKDARLQRNTGNTAGAEPDRFGMSFDAYRLGTERSSQRSTGLASHVSFNPDVITPRLPSGVTDGSRPAFVGLAHELVHSSRQQKGYALDTSMGQLERAAEEVETVGMVPSRHRITENSIRSEHGLARRTTYGGGSTSVFSAMLRRAGMARDY